MATPNCDLCEQTPADLIIGMVATGDQAFVCAGCLPAFIGALIGPPASEGETPQVAAEAPETAQETPGDTWEADYPQPAPEAPRSRKRAQNGQTTEASETAPAAADHE